MLAPWRSLLSRALHLHRSQPQSRYFQLATVTPVGLPCNRTVVFRGFYLETNTLQIVTDTRSEKIAHIEHQPWGEICWYFAKTRDQFRLSGKLSLVLVSERDVKLQQARYATWKNLSEAGRAQFAWPYPKQSRSEDKSDFIVGALDEDKPLDNFCLVLFEPQQVDHLQLKGDPQNRSLYILDESGDWLVKEVNP